MLKLAALITASISLFMSATACGASVQLSFAQQTFYNAHMRKVVEEQAMNNKHFLPEVRKLIADLRQRIETRYHAGVNIKLNTEYHQTSRMINEGSAVENGVPVIEIFLPAEMNNYEEFLKQSVKDRDAIFENSLLIGMVHELQHLAYGLVGSSKTSQEILNQYESATWARTCEEIVRPLIEKGMPISRSDLNWYLDWVAGGRTATSKSWNDTIKQIYGATRQGM